MPATCGALSSKQRAAAALSFADKARRLTMEALEAWVECKPQGYTLDAQRVSELLPVIAAHVPNRSPGKKVRELGVLFAVQKDGDQPVFVQLLRIQDGLVHFLYFWKAFDEACRMVETEPAPSEGLNSELETLRDRILRCLEEQSCAQAPGSDASAPCIIGQTFPTGRLTEEIHRAASMSGSPEFWQSAAATLAGPLELAELRLEELTSILLSWVQLVAFWDTQAFTDGHGSMLQRSDSTVSSASTASTAGAPRKKKEPQGLPVKLHIYDVSQEESIQKLNRVLAHKHSPLKLGGVFHAGVEVNGLEWSFGFSCSETRSGISCCEPQKNTQHTYRQTVSMRHTGADPEQIADIIAQLIEEYPGDDYDLLRRNCCHFADDFCRRMGVGGIPGWVHRLARIGAGVDSLLQAAPQSVKDRVFGQLV